MDGRTFKIVLMGDGSSGKTSIISRYAQDHFGADYRQTVGVDFFSKSLELPGSTVFILFIYCFVRSGFPLRRSESR
jgi:GTPase SAR1 family protein